MDAMCDHDVATRLGRAELLHAVCHKPHERREISLHGRLGAEEGAPRLEMKFFFFPSRKSCRIPEMT
jgi:hypothetical protein